MVSTIEEAIDKKAYDSGNITGSRLCEILDDHQAKSSELVDGRLQAMNERLKSVQEEFHDIASGSEQHVICAPPDNNSATVDSRKSNIYQYSGQFFDVLETFEFPKVNIHDGMQFWYLGQSFSNDGLQVVKPFRKINFCQRDCKVFISYSGKEYFRSLKVVLTSQQAAQIFLPSKILPHYLNSLLHI